MDYSNLYLVFAGVFLNSIQALLAVFVFSFMVFKQKFIKNYILYSLLFGILCSFAGWIITLFLPTVSMAISTIITLLFYFIAFKFILHFNVMKCGISLFLTSVLYIVSSLGTAAIFSLFNEKKLFSDFNEYALACVLTFVLYTIQLLIIKFFKLTSKLPPSVRNGIFISNIGFLTVTVIIIICNMNYFVYMADIGNKWILIANCAVFLYLIYANVNSNIGLFKYKKLMDEYVATVAELAVVNERNRFARDAHDTIGHTMSRIIALLEKCRNSCSNDETSERMLGEATDYAREGLQELRRSIIGMAPEKPESEELENVLKKLFSGFSASGVKIDFTMQGKFTGSVKLSDTIYKICKEALSNSVLHGNAANVTVLLRNEDMLKLFICDDGAGCDTLKKGFGISNMEQRVTELGGRLDCGPLEGKGFQIYATMPLY